MRRRQGFTIVELLVSMALILFVMAILSEAFIMATQSLRDFKAAGDLAEKLRATTTLLRRDLAAQHFDGARRLSDASFWTAGPPTQGFFRIYQSGTGIKEGANLEGVPVYLTDGSTNGNHLLHMAVNIPTTSGKQPSDFFTVPLPGDPTSPLNYPNPEARYQDTSGTNMYTYQWAEVMYFLRPAVNANSIQDQTTGKPAIPLYSLYRRQLVAVPPSTTNPSQTVPGPAYSEVSQFSGTFNQAEDLTQPVRRFGLTGLEGTPSNTAPVTGVPTYPILGNSNDLLLTDVISFDIRILLAGSSTFVDLSQVQTYNTLGNPKYSPTAPPYVFDTWSNNAGSSYYSPTWPLGVTSPNAIIPLYQDAKSNKIQIIAIQIVLRVWDPKTSMTRQVRLVQNL
jgi:prepilin-type N-terminal cleavage/methylation domain-containing protein